MHKTLNIYRLSLRGRKYHYVPPHSATALCSTKPVPRSGGWSDQQGPAATCTRCIARFNALVLNAITGATQ